MKSRTAVLALATGLVLAATVVEVQAANATVTYKDGLVTIHCKDTPLSQVFDQLKAASGLQVILDGAVRSVRLTAEIDSQPLNFALERLLEGTGVNYAMFLDRGNWQRVAKIYIGSAGGSVARGGSSTPASTPTPPRRGPVARPADVDEGVDEDEPDGGEPESPTPADTSGEADESADENAEPPGASPAPAPNYLPPPPAFPRSSFTPGLDSNPFGSSQPATGGTPPSNPPGSAGSESTGPGNPPPAYFPFFDAFGRPIPVNPQQQQQQQPQTGSGQQQKKQ